VIRFRKSWTWLTPDFIKEDLIDKNEKWGKFTLVMTLITDITRNSTKKTARPVRRIWSTHFFERNSTFFPQWRSCIIILCPAKVMDNNNNNYWYFRRLKHDALIIFATNSVLDKFVLP